MSTQGSKANQAWRVTTYPARDTQAGVTEGLKIGVGSTAIVKRKHMS